VRLRNYSLLTRKMFARILCRVSTRSRLLISNRTYARGNRGNRLDVPNGPRTGRAGVRKQSRMLDNIDDFFDDPEDFHSQEVDIVELKDIRRNLAHEVLYDEQKIKQKMIQKKYFNGAKGINFLTWCEKEQIRQLYEKDSETLPIERLAESFPVSIENVVKVVKAKWYPSDAKRIQKHDQAVKENWHKFKRNKLEQELDPEFVVHLKKFSHREFDNTIDNVSLKAIEANKFQFPKPTSTEFSSFITGCKGYKNTQPQLTDGEKSVAVAEPKSTPDKDMCMSTGLPEDTYRLGPIYNKKHVQFDDISKLKSFPKSAKPKSTGGESMNPFQRPIDSDFESTGTKREEQDGVIVLRQEEFFAEKPKNTRNIERTEKTKPIQRYESGKMAVDEILTPLEETEIVHDRINIPLNVYKKGAVYQLKDCFYHSDGELLFRVPGIMPKKCG